GILSCPDAIGRMIEKVAKMNGELKEEVKKTIPYIHYGESETKTLIRKEEKSSESRPCPECGSPLESDGGCVICRACGYSKCN
ncbi:MAG: ribonucleotide-diphosphate reductase subunit alpha, partial [Clostridia bacterium]